jgi:Holliday junction resolvasome RuvABC endonuclease subunit
MSMRILSIDPGGERCGWAVLDPGPTYVASGVLSWPRNGQVYQSYRMDLTNYARDAFLDLVEIYEPEKVVVEIVPAVGSVGFMSSGQGYIANVVATTMHNIAHQVEVPVEQVSARAWESKIAKRGKSKKITKAQIRNGVLVHLPKLKQKLAAHLNEWDRWDSVAIGLFALGYVTK